MIQQRSWIVFVGALFTFALAGCGGSSGTLSGQATYQGQPIPVGTITFFGSGEGSPQTTAMISNGSYRANDVPLGPTTVTVSAPEPRTTPDPLAPPDAAQIEPIPIPKKYETASTSGLSVTVTGGSQTYDIKLE